MTHAWRRGIALGLATVLVLATVPSLVDSRSHPDELDREGAQPDYAQCIKPNVRGPEFYGPTAINAETANGGLAAAFTETGTVSVFRYPSPSYYDQVKYHTTDRDAPRYGVAPNEGMFLGVVTETATSPEPSTTWLRDFGTVSQAYEPGRTDVVETTYVDDDLGLEVTVRDVAAAPPTDALARHVEVTRLQGSPVTDAALVSFENLNLVVSKWTHIPSQDWCQEEENRDLATYDDEADAIVHRKEGVDRSTGQHQSVAVATGFGGDSDGHQVGGDAYEPSAAPIARLQGPVQDAYDDAGDGTLAGNDRYLGQTTGAMTTALDFDGPLSDGAEATVYFAGGSSPEAAVSTLEDAREAGFPDLAAEKEDWLEAKLDDAPEPDLSQDASLTAAERDAVESLADRAVVTLVTNIDRRSKAIVASIATQSPYGEDWPRDGAYFNHALDVMGLHGEVDEHNRFYQDVQVKERQADETQTPFVPPGNWAMNYYADGVPAGPIPWEIDETAYAVWTFWDHYRATGDVGELEAVFPALQRAADFLVDCKDPRNDLTCRAWEDDREVPSQTIRGAATVWLALESAADAARTLDEPGDALRYQDRADELREAIDAELWDPGTGSYGPDLTGHAETAWPVCFEPTVEGRFDDHLESVWAGVSSTVDQTQPEGASGAYESKGLLALAKHWKDDPDRMDDVRRGLLWVATEHATADTHVLGEFWLKEDGEIESVVAQPHTWEQTLFYMAALEAWPPAQVQDAGAGCGGALDEFTGTPGDPGGQLSASLPDLLTP